MAVRLDGLLDSRVVLADQFLVTYRGVAARRIDADPGQPGTASFELIVIPGVADQLPVAVRSPVAPVEDEHERAPGEL